MLMRNRLPLIALAGLALLAGMWAGLNRLGWALPPLRPAAHGPLMISGFLGTVISLERVVAFRRRWTYAAPVLTSAGAILLLLGAPDPVYRGSIALGSLVLLMAFAVAYYQHYGLKVEWAAATMIVGVASWLVGNGLWWAGRSLSQVTPWWIGFLILTIAGERLELARVLLLNRTSRITFVLSAGLFLGGLVFSLVTFSAGLQVSGAGLIALGAWLLYFDVARRTIRQAGLTRFIAACLLPGYVWLIVAGAFWMLWPSYFAGGPFYDAMLHTILLGFVFSMIFGHEPIIVPAILGTPMIYRPVFYVHLVLLHLSLILRVAGDLTVTPPIRMWGGLLNVIALLIFMGNTILAVRSRKNGA
jgi:hypothetical protein